MPSCRRRSVVRCSDDLPATSSKAGGKGESATGVAAASDVELMSTNPRMSIVLTCNHPGGASTVDTGKRSAEGHSGGKNRPDFGPGRDLAMLVCDLKSWAPLALKNVQPRTKAERGQ